MISRNFTQNQLSVSYKSVALFVFYKTQRSDSVLGCGWRQTNDEDRKTKTKKILSGQTEGVTTNNSPNQCSMIYSFKFI